MIPVRILGTGSALPGRSIETAALARVAYPDRQAGYLEARTGIQTRWWAEAGTTRAEVAAEALAKALEAAGLPASALERIVFVDSAGGDAKMPATANAVAAAFGLGPSCDCFDLNNACTGFLTAMDLAARCVATGSGPVAVVSAELWSPHLDPSEPRTYVVFGDAAAAAIYGPARGPHEGVRASWLRNDARVGGSVRLEHGGVAGSRELVRFRVDNRQIGAEATEAILDSVARVLAAAEVEIDAVNWVLPHQPNGRMFDTLLDRLGVERARSVPLVAQVGSVGAASVGLSLDRLVRSGRVEPGDLILLAAVGSGISYGALLYQVGPEVGP